MRGYITSISLGGRKQRLEIRNCFEQYFGGLEKKSNAGFGFSYDYDAEREYKTNKQIEKIRSLDFAETLSLEHEPTDPEGYGYLDRFGSAEAYIQYYTTLFVDGMRFMIEEDDAAIILIDGSGTDELFFLDAYQDEFLDKRMFEAGYYDMVENILDFPDEATAFVCEKLLETMRMCWMVGINNTRLDRNVFLPKALKNLGLDTGFFAGQFQIFEKGKATMVIPHSSSAPLPYMLYKAKEELRKKGKSFIWQPDSLVGYPV